MSPATDAASSREPPTYVLDSHRSPHPFFTPTHLSLLDLHTGAKAGSWSSRRARKGRYRPQNVDLHYVRHGSANPENGAPVTERKIDKQKTAVEHREQMAVARIKRVEREKLKPGLRMDVSFWIAVLFTFGSAVWVVNGYLVWFPILRPALDTDPVNNSAAATAFIGGSIFLIGSYLMVVEALDRGRETTFGTAFGQLLHHRRSTPPDAAVNREQINKQARQSSSSTSTTDRGGEANHESQEGSLPGAKAFIWWGKPLWHDLGYLAAIIQLFAATIFWISTITGLNGVIPGFFEGGGSTAIIDVFFWTPQVVGGSGFIISSLILMIEVQKRWWLPNLTDVGWWVGLWNLIGAVGFTLCGALGYSSVSGAEYESGLSTFWGSWAFLFGSFMQTWEVIWREPSDDEKGK